ncbi:putative nucleic acid-binding protein [Helianthus annuus]|uniref:Nucleic acid-binding protein n=2 Tax=Helianthus annuus TaxID=4232 RepID=A0A251UTM9_HELAN|nr:replication protein A 70 kDa DNA-binding subunit C [Helianthus annuus]KAF5798177.1 putative nucleic acid-binding protein [Helianthus annuus]KAJ0549810.1 putative nucleic acid-binding protein [Helianthus annuus]KAJ0556324.1 putative nucleic acid-binding protein [Helianthus annuus]KAJ0562765.1 putative nucleic acid-binding protein [Helianthus annuus]KAJ0730909.1 putative nucleic acid-binding protein [Helianthus annuus]
MELYICDRCYYLILHCIRLPSIASISLNFSSMALNKVTLISDLDVLLESYKLKVKIIRLWKQTVRGNPKETYAIEMVLMDEQGNKIQAKVWKQCVSKFENLHEENGDFYIEKPQLASNDSPYKYANNRYKLTFNWVTKVTKCTDFNGPDTNLAFATLPSILADEPKKDCTIDVIGEVLQCFEMEYHMINGIRTKKQNVEVRDLDNLKIYVTLWGVFVDQMQAYLKDNAEKRPCVIILQFGKLKWHRGRAYVSNSYYSVSRLLINDQTKEIIEYKKKLLSKAANDSSSSQRSTSSSIVYSLHNEFVHKFPFSSIANIQGFKKEQSVIILGTIKGIRKDAGWYYHACNKCTRKVEKNGFH